MVEKGTKNGKKGKGQYGIFWIVCAFVEGDWYRRRYDWSMVKVATTLYSMMLNQGFTITKSKGYIFIFLFEYDLGNCLLCWDRSFLRVS